MKHAHREALTLKVDCTGCNFCQELARDLHRQVLPKLREAGYKLYLVSTITLLPRHAQVPVFCLRLHVASWSARRVLC